MPTHIYGRERATLSYRHPHAAVPSSRDRSYLPGVHGIGRAHFANASSGKYREVRGRPGDILETQEGTQLTAEIPGGNWRGVRDSNPWPPA